MVVSAQPSAPPMALLVLQQMLSKQYKVLTACHRHSSAVGVTEQHMSVFGDGGLAVTTDRNSYDMVFTLIWKDGNTLRISYFIVHTRNRNDRPTIM